MFYFIFPFQNQKWLDEYCRMVDREGKQVLLCTWSRRSPALDFDFAFLENSESAEEQRVSGFFFGFFFKWTKKQVSNFETPFK